MSIYGCHYQCSCRLLAVIASVIIGVITAFLQITGTVTATPAFLWVVFGVAVAYLGVLVVAAALSGRGDPTGCVCSALNALLIGILGSVLFALALLAVGIVATSVLSAILVGITLFFFALMLTSTACLVRYLVNCRS